MGKRRGDRRHAAPGRGNPMNLTIGCGMQQAREPAGGGSRRGREKRRGRNEQRAGRRRADASFWLAGVDTSCDVDGEAVFERTLWKALGSASRAAARCVSDFGCASTRRAVGTPVHTARSRGTTARFVRPRTDAVEASLRERPHDPEPRAVKSSPLTRGRSTAAGERRSEACERLVPPAHRAGP